MENGIILNPLVDAVWIIYLVAFLAIRFGTQKTPLPILVTFRFKILIAVLVTLQIIFYASYAPGGQQILSIPSNILLFFGMILMSCGLILSIIAYYQLRKYGIELPAPRGIHKIMRWPIHCGLILLWFGAALILNSNLGIVMGIVLLIPIIYYQVKSEEKDIMVALTAKGPGNNYQNYIENSWTLFPKFF